MATRRPENVTAGPHDYYREGPYLTRRDFCLSASALLAMPATALDAFSVICRIAETNGVSLWKYRTPKGVGIETAFHYLVPFVAHPDTWRKPQITKYSADSTIFSGFAGAGLHDDGLLAAHRALRRSSSPWVQFVDPAVSA